MVIGESVARAFDDLYYFERACATYITALQTGSCVSSPMPSCHRSQLIGEVRFSAGLPIQAPHLTEQRFGSVRWQVPQHLGDDAATRIVAARRESEPFAEAGFRVRIRPFVQHNRVDPGVGVQFPVEAGFPLAQRVTQVHPRIQGCQILAPEPLGYERHELGEDLLTANHSRTS